MKNKFKRLAIVSDCVHMVDEEGNIATENHVFCRQMQALASCFEHTVICCPFVKKGAENVLTIYPTNNIDFLPLPHVGGNTIRHKLQIIKTIPVWIKAFGNISRRTDLVYLRMPNNLSIPGFFYFYFKRSKMFTTYTGTWKNYKGEPITYRFQKWILKNFFNGCVWIYTAEKIMKKNFLKNYSPSYSLAEWDEETEQINIRLNKYKAGLMNKPVFITVGSLVAYKNQQYVLEVCKQLREMNFCFHWYIVGDGPLKSDYLKFVEDNNLDSCVSVTGKKTYQALRRLYREAHFLVQPTLIEGFGKAPIEAMFHGVIPVLNKVAMADEMTGSGSRGYIFSAENVDNLVFLIRDIMNEQKKFAGLIINGREYAKEQTLEKWAETYIYTINEYYK